MDRNKVLIVDPYVSTEYLATSLAEKHIACDALYTSTIQENKHADLHKHLFHHVIDSTMYSEDILHRLIVENEYDFILNGAEEATAFTDRLANACCPECANNPLTSELRANKWAMNKAAAMAGLNTIRSTVVNAPFKVEDVKKAIEEIGLPVFCKPIGGFGSVGVFRADTIAEVVRFLANPVCGKFEQYIIQEEINGLEVLVDTFSAEGSHYVCCISRNPKTIIDGRPIYRMTSVEEDQRIWESCSRYVQSLLRALDFRHGFAHTELFFLVDGSIKLIEMNNRISGGHGSVNKIARLCGFTAQDDALGQYLRKRRVDTRQQNQRHGHACNLVLFGLSKASWGSLKCEVADFRSVCELLFSGIGDTQNDAGPPSLMDASCFVVMHSEDKHVLDTEVQAIFAWEAAHGRQRL